MGFRPAAQHSKEDRHKEDLPRIAADASRSFVPCTMEDACALGIHEIVLYVYTAWLWCP